MKTQNITIAFGFIIGMLMSACESKPRVIESEPMTNESFATFRSPTDVASDPVASSEEHRVKIKEALDTEKYTYLSVIEDENTFWIAIPKMKVEIGATYYYKGGLLKKNFQSKEHNRVFETVYLVSNIVPANAKVKALPKNMEASIEESIKVESVEGAIKISELLSDPNKYQGKLVKVTGKCVKINPMIMQRNWVHLQDGSGDGLDLTITTNENIPLGAVVSLEGTIALNKDFGAGYRYEIIMEGAVLQ